MCRVVTSQRWLRLAVAPPDGLDDPAEQVIRSPGFLKRFFRRLEEPRMDRARLARPNMPHVRPGARGRALSLKSGYAEWVQIHIFLSLPYPLGKNAVGAGCGAVPPRPGGARRTCTLPLGVFYLEHGSATTFPKPYCYFGRDYRKRAPVGNRRSFLVQPCTEVKTRKPREPVDCTSTLC